jgi:hypothetical protein
MWRSCSAALLSGPSCACRAAAPRPSARWSHSQPKASTSGRAAAAAEDEGAAVGCKAAAEGRALPALVALQGQTGRGGCCGHVGPGWPLRTRQAVQRCRSAARRGCPIPPAPAMHAASSWLGVATPPFPPTPAPRGAPALSARLAGDAWSAATGSCSGALAGAAATAALYRSTTSCTSSSSRRSCCCRASSWRSWPSRSEARPESTCGGGRRQRSERWGPFAARERGGPLAGCRGPGSAAGPAAGWRLWGRAAARSWAGPRGGACCVM